MGVYYRQFSASVALTAPTALHMQFLEGYEFQLLDYCGHFCFEVWTEEEEQQRKLYGVVLALINYAAPVAVISFCYLSIYWKLTKVSQHCQFVSDLFPFVCCV